MEGESWRKINVFKVAAGSAEGDVWTPKCENHVGLNKTEWIFCEEGRRKRGLKITTVNYLEAEDNEARLDYRRISVFWMSKR